MSEAQFTAEEQEWVDAFLAETTLFLGPDPEIMNDHRMAPRTAEEDRLLSGPVDANDLDRVRKRIVAGLDEAFEMMEQTGAAPGAKWGDLTSAVYSASGDLIHISTGGVLAFASVLHYPVRFINKYWVGDPTVGVRDGDAFIHNDARYGNIHNTDQSMILPVFYDGELIAWVATIIHEGENGAKEPGGMPSSSESAYDDGIRMSPFKIVERGPDPARPADLPAELGARAEAAVPGPEGQALLGAADQGAPDRPGRRGRPGRVHRLAAQVAGGHRGRGAAADLGAAGRHLPGQLLLRLHPARERPAEVPVRDHRAGRRADHRLARRRAAVPQPGVQRHPRHRQVRPGPGAARLLLAGPAPGDQRDEPDGGADRRGQLHQPGHRRAARAEPAGRLQDLRGRASRCSPRCSTPARRSTGR